jgi:uncharacterized protein
MKSHTQHNYNHSLCLPSTRRNHSTQHHETFLWQPTRCFVFVVIALAVTTSKSVVEVSAFSPLLVSIPEKQQQQQHHLSILQQSSQFNNNNKYQRSSRGGHQHTNPTTAISPFRSEQALSSTASLVLLHSFFQDKNDLVTETNSIDDDSDDDDSSVVNDARDQWYTSSMTTTMVSTQAAFIPIGVVLATVIGIDLNFLQLRNYDSSLLLFGTLSTIPLIVFAIVLDIIEDQIPALQEVSEATLRSVYNLLGGSYKPVLATATAVVLGTVAGVGEEILFRGILQETIYQQHWTSNYNTIISIVISSIVFGLFHAVTPMYIVLATLASMYFGTLYALCNGDLTIPILCHSIYDIGALLYAHYTISQLSFTKLQQLIVGEGSETSTS